MPHSRLHCIHCTSHYLILRLAYQTNVSEWKKVLRAGELPAARCCSWGLVQLIVFYKKAYSQKGLLFTTRVKRASMGTVCMRSALQYHPSFSLCAPAGCQLASELLRLAGVGAGVGVEPGGVGRLVRLAPRAGRTPVHRVAGRGRAQAGLARVHCKFYCRQLSISQTFGTSRLLIIEGHPNQAHLWVAQGVQPSAVKSTPDKSAA